MLVQTMDIIFLGAKKNLSKKDSDKRFSLYTFFDPSDNETSTIFSSDDSLDSFLNPMEKCRCLINVRGNFLNLKQIMAVTSDE